MASAFLSQTGPFRGLVWRRINEQYAQSQQGHIENWKTVSAFGLEPVGQDCTFPQIGDRNADLLSMIVSFRFDADRRWYRTFDVNGADTGLLLTEERLLELRRVNHYVAPAENRFLP